MFSRPRPGATCGRVLFCTASRCGYACPSDFESVVAVTGSLVVHIFLFIAVLLKSHLTTSIASRQWMMNIDLFTPEYAASFLFPFPVCLYSYIVSIFRRRWTLEEERFFCTSLNQLEVWSVYHVARRFLLYRCRLCRQPAAATCWGRTSTGRSSTSPAIRPDRRRSPSPADFPKLMQVKNIIKHTLLAFSPALWRPCGRT